MESSAGMCPPCISLKYDIINQNTELKPNGIQRNEKAKYEQYKDEEISNKIDPLCNSYFEII